MFYDYGKICSTIIKGCILSTLLAGCATDFKYIPKRDLASDPLYLINTPNSAPPKNYGAIKFQQDGMDDNEGHLFILQKTKGIYQAETMFKSSKDKKYFFSFGMNYKLKTPHIGFRLEF